MALIVRIDVDRPYGKQGLARHVASRLASDYGLPRLPGLGYLRELETILGLLAERGHRAHVFFRQCTFPSAAVRALMDSGGHDYALHLENSRTPESFLGELRAAEAAFARPVLSFSKHGSGRYRYGRHHHAPYEPERYLPWAREAGLRLFLGNLEDPRLEPESREGMLFFPSAFWLEPSWRDTSLFPIEWLLREAALRDVVMLFHPDNVVSDPRILREFLLAVDTLETKLALPLK